MRKIIACVLVFIATSAWASPPKPATPEVKCLIAREALLNDQCRNGSDIHTAEYCSLRNDADERLHRLGWCWGHTGQPEYKKEWEHCKAENTAILSSQEAHGLIGLFNAVNRPLTNQPRDVQIAALQESEQLADKLRLGGWCYDTEGLAGKRGGWLPCTSTTNQHILSENEIFLALARKRKADRELHEAIRGLGANTPINSYP